MDEVVSPAKGDVLGGSTNEGRTLHSGVESMGSKGLADPKPPAAQGKSALEMSPSATEHYL